MIDPAAPRQSKGWPLIAISLLVVLLAGFLVIRWRKKEEIPAIVKQPSPPVEPVKPLEPVKPIEPAKPPPVERPPNVADTEFEKRVEELRALIHAKRWDDAAATFDAAQKLRADAAELKGVEAIIAEGRKKEEADRVEAARKAALKQKQEREWAVLKDKVQKDREQNLWDAALLSFDKFVKEYADVARDEDYLNAVKQIRVLQGEADAYFKKDLAEAQKHFEAGRFGQAISVSEGSLALYPERKPQVREFQERVRIAQSEKLMVRIPSTACWIGSDDRDDEKPLRQVKLPPFLIDKYEVTQEDYFGFTAATGRAVPAFWLPFAKPPKGRERHPVFMVTWDDAAAYAAWAGKRLPSAEEWEVAARGFDKREFPWGNVFLEKEDKFPCNCLEYWQVHKNLAPGTTPVDEKDFDNGVSAFGVYGMGGNVWEWTATAAPAKGSNPPSEFRILKGGSFMTPQKAIRSANSYAEDPRLPHPDVGFRCVRDVK